MTEPSKERIAAALALAEAVDAAARACDAPEGTPSEVFTRVWFARCEALAAYRATAPKPLRTRAEVDADIAARTRELVRIGRGDFTSVWALCDEPTAESGCKSEEHEPDPEACSCDESERLHGYMKDIKALHRVWSDNGADPFQTLTCVGNVLLRWMSNLP
jgi:hypothetical protein